PTVLAANQDRPRFLALDSTSVYWTTTSEVHKVPVGGGSVVPLASVLSPPPRGRPWAVAVDRSAVYFTSGDDKSVYEVPLTGGPTQTLAESQFSPLSLVVAGAGAYWTNTDGSVRRWLRATGAVDTLATDSANLFPNHLLHVG